MCLLSVFGFPIELWFSVSTWIIICSIILIVISIAYNIYSKRKTNEQKTASKIVKQISSFKKNKSSKVKNKKSVNDKNSKVMPKKPSGMTMKDFLIKKFKPKIESQLDLDFEIIDIKPDKKNFLITTKVEDILFELILDSSGKIIDFKRKN